ncbi:hypothetical protein [Aestuariirhabdus sp. LZHN29]|uniref:hypothetical protein n=1 Tax=Aestuariirhabdus sp. LZHN29 TaxID=3417462 RepID=UPI003CF68BF2
MKFNHIFMAVGLTLTALSGNLYASAGHAEGGHDAMDQSAAGNKMFLVKRDIDGYKVSFHVMEANESMRNGGSYNLMIKVENQGKAIDDLRVNSKVVFPDGNDQSKPLKKMGDWYVTGYDLKPGGKHQLMVLFMTPDGKKHFGGVHYQ